MLDTGTSFRAISQQLCRRPSLKGKLLMSGLLQDRDRFMRGKVGGGVVM